MFMFLQNAKPVFWRLRVKGLSGLMVVLWHQYGHQLFEDAIK